MPGAEWFPRATLNYAEHMLRAPGLDENDDAVISLSQSREPVVLTLKELRSAVARCQEGLRSLGVQRGDRVAGYVPNIAEALVAMLATASIGAIWTACPPEFGVGAVIDRLAQIEPKVLLAVDGYRYGSKAIGRTAQLAEIRSRLPSLEQTVIIPYLEDGSAGIPDSLTWDALLYRPAPAEPTFDYVPFHHPLYILYSSGTTGLPKAIVHGHGGITVEHCKQLGFYTDLAPNDRFFWFSTTGWMMWNYLVSGLLVGSKIVLFDGDPASDGLEQMWKLVADLGVTFFGTSAAFLMACTRAGLVPADRFDLRALRGIGSTGSPLPAEGFDWVYASVKPDVLLSSVSGGTDVCSAFVGGSPLTPVRAGELSCRYVGCDVKAFDAGGTEVTEDVGELVVTQPMPSMPVSFWNDADGSRYQQAYFAEFPGVWHHGDWITIHADGSCIISGRSDSTLNRGGVRLGTADFYAVVEALPEVTDSLVVHLPEAGSDDSGLIMLFVVLAEEEGSLDDALRARIATQLRTTLSPRHVPDRIAVVPSIPRTLSGKKLEIPVKRILTGTPVSAATNKDVLADPAALEAFEILAASMQRAPDPSPGQAPNER